jgi:hypothetical protein
MKYQPTSNDTPDATMNVVDTSVRPSRVTRLI